MLIKHFFGTTCNYTIDYLAVSKKFIGVKIAKNIAFFYINIFILTFKNHITYILTKIILIKTQN